MIEVLVEDRCVECNLCVKVCPLNVFEKRENQPPVIARQSDCQTCYMCELYCPAQALYVSLTQKIQWMFLWIIKETGLFGSYRKDIGWEKGYKSAASQDACL